MRRIKLILAVGVVMVAILALNAGSAMADEFELDDFDFGGRVEEVDVFGDELEVEFANGEELEFDIVDDDIDFDDDFEIDLD